MKATLAQWVSNADALRHLEHFGVKDIPAELVEVRTRADDYYTALVGALFECLKSDATPATEWARIGNALAQFATEDQQARLDGVGVSRGEAVLFAATAFYCGGFPASAYLTIRSCEQEQPSSDIHKACLDLLGRRATPTSATGTALVGALTRGDMAAIDKLQAKTREQSRKLLDSGPDAWIPSRLLERLVDRFHECNVRAVLPDGGSSFWNSFVSSLTGRKPAAWEFFPSQIEAIKRGLLEKDDTFSLQMPTGAGKTALCETLLYWQAKRADTGVAIFLVPYRSLASELRQTVVKRLNAMGIRTRCAYGGTVPTGDEVRALKDTRVIVATPESLHGLLGVDADFFQRISLLICDEGHLLDGGARGVGLEVLLARMRSREGRPPKFVFVSAIVPNIEEINAWLGGMPNTVVRSDYRPAIAEFAVLRSTGNGQAQPVSLDMHPHEAYPTRFVIDGFLSRADFQWLNQATGRSNTYSFSSAKTRAIAAARKALSMGAAAVFAANKRGEQGAIGLAEELIAQLSCKMPLPEPASFVNGVKVDAAVKYLELEYGANWLGTRALAAGAVLHHGDIPQETREVVESLLRQGDLRLAICTSTLAEGVNLPIRTLVLYSVQRRNRIGLPENLLARDIKNLVGRAGRAGSTTKGLVICANEKQWPLIERVAKQAPGEPVRGALLALVNEVQGALAASKIALTNSILENSPELHTLVDGIDSTLVNLAAEEVGEGELVAMAVKIANQTFAAIQAAPVAKKLLQDVFELRARRLIGIQSAGKLGWIRETGARARILDAVENELLPSLERWDDIADSLDSDTVDVILNWAWGRVDTQEAVRKAYFLDSEQDATAIKASFVDTVKAWLDGVRFKDIATRSRLPMDDLLRIHSGAISFVLQTIVEHGIALLKKLLESDGKSLATGVQLFPEHLRFGVPNAAALTLAINGIRHRSASVELGVSLTSNGVRGDDRVETLVAARDSIVSYRRDWETRLGSLVVENTLFDISSALGDVGN